MIKGLLVVVLLLIVAIAISIYKMFNIIRDIAEMVERTVSSTQHVDGHLKDIIDDLSTINSNVVKVDNRLDNHIKLVIKQGKVISSISSKAIGINKKLNSLTLDAQTLKLDSKSSNDIKVNTEPKTAQKSNVSRKSRNRK